MNKTKPISYSASQILNKIINEYDIHEILKVDPEMKYILKHTKEHDTVLSSKLVFMKNYLDVLDYVCKKIDFERVRIDKLVSMSYENNKVTISVDYTTFEPRESFSNTFVIYDISYKQYENLHHKFVNKFTNIIDVHDRSIILKF